MVSYVYRYIYIYGKKVVEDGGGNNAALTEGERRGCSCRTTRRESRATNLYERFDTD